MSLAWVAHCVAVAVLLGVAARILEGALRGAGRPARWVWTGSLMGSLALPLASWQGWIASSGLFSWSLWDAMSGASRGWRSGMPGGESIILSIPGGEGWTVIPTEIPLATARWSTLLSGEVLVAVWALSSAAVLALVLRSAWSLRLERASWRPAVVDGVPVLVSATVGPAALGVVRGAIVVPEWALALESRLRRLLLLHEVEHLRAGDPRLLLAGLLAVVIMPWNPVIWWQFRKLRQALELDCDRRVLRAVPDVRSYGLLLLEVGRRDLTGGVVLAGLAGSGRFLERRIHMLGRSNALNESVPGSARARLLVGAGMAAFLVLLACDAREPTSLDEVPGGSMVEGSEPAGPRLDLAEVSERARLAGGAERSCSPVFFLDGDVVDDGGGDIFSVSGLDPADISSIEVIKGRAALRLLPEHPGQDLSCGVVRITSKRAAASEAVASVSAANRLVAERGLILEAASWEYGEGERERLLVGRDVVIRAQRSTQ